MEDLKTKHLVATRRFPYQTRHLAADEHFVAASERDAQILTAVGRARYATKDEIAGNTGDEQASTSKTAAKTPAKAKASQPAAKKPATAPAAPTTAPAPAPAQAEQHQRRASDDGQPAAGTQVPVQPPSPGAVGPMTTGSSPLVPDHIRGGNEPAAGDKPADEAPKTEQ